MLSPFGVLDCCIKKGAFNSAEMRLFAENTLLPLLEPGDVVVLDNARIHHNREFRELFDAEGVRLLFLPPYSPEMMPVSFKG